MSYTMVTTTDESDDAIYSTIYNNESPSTPADNNNNIGGNGGCTSRGGGKASVLKKGPWTSTEDGILINYVNRHGEGNWNNVQKHTSLARCGKSCRLRWANHLRPNLKKGAFSKEEEHLIVEMHARMGNKWAQMAEHLPGRTDNEIKNYWNTRIKRRQRAGLPLYPPGVHVEDLHWSQEYPTTSNITTGVDRRRHQDILQLGNSKANVLFEDLNFANVLFEDLNFATSLLPGASGISNMFACNMLGTGASSSSRYESYMLPILPSSRQEFQSPEHFQNAAPQKNPRACSVSEHPMYGNQHLSDVMFPESHTFTDGMLPTSKPLFGAVKLELPSFQYSETSGFDQWKTTPSPPQSDLLDSVDTYIQSPPPLEIDEPDCFSSCDTGLLDMLLHEAKIKASAKHSLFKSINSTTSASDATQNVPRAGESEAFQNNWTRSEIPIPTQLSAGGNSSDYVVKTEELDQVWEPKRVDVIRPDVLLASSWQDQQGRFGIVRDSSSMSDALALLLGG